MDEHNFWLALQYEETYDGCPCWQIHLNEILSSIPFERCREEPRTLRVASKSTKGWLIRVYNDLISASLLYPTR